MITCKQITKSSSIAALSDYYVLDVRTTGPDPSVNAISSLAVLQVRDNLVVKEAFVRVASDAEAESGTETGYRSAVQVAESMARLLLDEAVVTEPSALQFLCRLLEQHAYEGLIRFVPIGKLVSTLFPDAGSGNIQEQARNLNIPERDNAGLMRIAYFEQALFLRCRAALGARLPEKAIAESDSGFSEKGQHSRHSARQAPRISSKTLKRWAKSVWSVSPWVVVGVAFLLVLFFVIHLPRKENNEVDRNSAPVNYLVLSWDKTGKYGTKARSHGDEASPIQFRVPYGVYNVLNNNSIPVELNIVTEENLSPLPSVMPEEEENGADSTSDSSQEDLPGVPDGEPGDTEATDADDKAAAVQLSSRGATDLAEEDEEETGPTKVTLRPNSTRQIIIDTNQYLTLSEDANDLILFYLSEVPEERESDTTGHDSGDSSRVVYAYVKGTEVRFRKSPSLEGAIIDVLQNGQQVQVLGVTGEWTHVSLQKDKGYIFSQFLTSEDPAAAAYEAKKAEETAQVAQESAPEPISDESGDTGTEAGTADSLQSPAPEA